MAQFFGILFAIVLAGDPPPLRGLRTVKAENYETVRARYAAVADTCNACHRTFARDAVTVKP